MTSAAQKNQPSFSCQGCQGIHFSPVGAKDGFALLRCADCGTATVSAYPSDQELAAHYQTHYKIGDYLRKKDAKIRRCAGRVRRMMGAKPPGKDFLDIGCNVGYMVAAAHRMGLKARGVDIDPSAIETAQKIFAGEGVFETVSIQSLAARGDTFDMVYMSEIIEHVPNPDTFMTSVVQVMRPGAVLYITAPDGGHFAVPRDFASWPMVCPPEHLTWFTRRGMNEMLARHGLKIETFQFAFKPGIKAIARKIP